MKANALINLFSLRRALSGLLLAMLLALVAAPVFAQAEELTLIVNKVVGAALKDQIRGTFSLAVRGPDDLQKVTYYIDGQPVGEATAAPWKFQFKTTDYPIGSHDITATGVTAGGATLQAAARTFEFISAGQEMAGVRNILGPILAGVGGILVITMLLQFVMFRSKGAREPLPLGAERNYGASGGTICPKCHRPFPLHWWAFNLLPGFKFETCPHCGRMGMVRRYSERELLQAEKAELEWGKPQIPAAQQTEADQLRDQLDDSKYMGS